jgi:UPF0271 protein
MIVEPLGDGALRFALPENTDARAVFDALRAIPNVIDVVVAERHAAIVFDDPPDVDAAIAAIENARPSVVSPRLHVIRVHYDGADLHEVAERARLDVDRVIELHSSREYIVRVVGFMPGFAYMGALAPELVLPRRASPRTRVPALSVAIAGDRTGVYPFASPGGWHLLGTSETHPFDPKSGALFALGDRVRFEAT